LFLTFSVAVVVVFFFVSALALQMVASMLEYGSSSVHGRLVIAVGW
jgi:hypothetical protein